MKRRIFVIFFAVAVVIGGLLLWPHAAAPKPAPAAPRPPYAALGDSVAAGLGLQPYSDPSACARTDQSYPHQVASGLDLRLYNLSCSGATMQNGILGSQEVNNLAVPAQLDQLFNLPKPRAVSLTVGANDAGWTSFLTKCYRAVCGTPEDTAAVGGSLTTLTSNLQDLFTRIQDHFGPAIPPVIVAGYYQVVPSPAASCQDLSGVDAAEQAWLRQEQTALNDAIRTAASPFAFVHYTDVDFSGHELCTDSPWVQGLADPAPYHPTAAGQTAYAKKVMAAISAATGESKR